MRAAIADAGAIPAEQATNHPGSVAAPVWQAAHQ
jgi:hypothetical protein